MRRIVVSAMVSLDGAMQAPGGPHEDPTQGFRFGGWVMPHFDAEFGEELDGLFGDFDLLLGRKTYEIFAAYWPTYDLSAPNGDIARRFNEVNKYVVSGSGEVDQGWSGTTLLRSIADVQRLKLGSGPDLLTQGSSALVQALFAHDLVDALSLFTVPVVLGGGKRLFAPGARPHAFPLRSARITSTGTLVGHYERGGDVPVAAADGVEDAPSVREVARRRRMGTEG